MKDVALILMLLPVAATAATITVNSPRDNTIAGNGACTLREAIANVNAAADTTGGDCTAGSGAGDTIVFHLHLPAKIVLWQGELDIAGNVNIVGPDSSPSGSSRLRIAGHTQDIAAVFLLRGATVTMSNLTIRSAKGAYSGLSTFDDVATLTNCTLDGGSNSAGRVLVNSGTLTMTNCTVKGGKGSGGIGNEYVLTMTNCTVRGNRGDSVDGAGILNTGNLTMTNCTIRDNKVRGSANAGGIYKLDGTMTLTNCTLYGNTVADGMGGGIYNEDGTATLTNCTLYGNTVRSIWGGPAIAILSGTVTLTNTLITQTNTLSAQPSSLQTPNCFSAFGYFVSGGHNLSTDFSCGGASTDLFNTPPNLAPPANYGGPTETLALCTAVGVPHPSCTGPSAAIDAGDDVVTGPPLTLTTDQRGLPRLSGAHVDIGAYEVQP
jgi:CSLREA domain-containing protein